MQRLLALLLVAGCAADEADPGELTYWRDVQPILASRCLQCHLRGPSSYRPWFDGYENVAQVAGNIAIAAKSREMPPWAVTADGTCRDWDRAHWLSGEEIAVLEEWARSDLIEGDAGDAALPVPAPASLRRVDAVVDTGVDYRPGLGDRLHRCFRAELSLPSPSYLTAFRVSPGNPSAVQHLSLYALDSEEAEAQAAALEAEDGEPGYHCFGDSRVPGARLLGTWTWGESSFRFPDGTGVRMEAGRDVIVQIHYSASGGSATPDPDRTRVELELADSADEGRFVPLEVPRLSLRPGEQSTFASALLAVPDDLTVHGLFPFMHGLGHSLLLLQGTGQECLAEVRHWDLYNHMRYHGYQEPLHLAAGDRVWLECKFDTRSRSEPVSSGESFEDESCLVQLYATSPAW